MLSGGQIYEKVDRATFSPSIAAQKHQLNNFSTIMYHGRPPIEIKDRRNRFF